jgi:hypothetical protein
MLFSFPTNHLSTLSLARKGDGTSFLFGNMGRLKDRGRRRVVARICVSAAKRVVRKSQPVKMVLSVIFPAFLRQDDEYRLGDFLRQMGVADLP